MGSCLHVHCLVAIFDPSMRQNETEQSRLVCRGEVERHDIDTI